MTDFGPDLFAGTAEFYAKFRPAYPAKMFNDIVNYYGLNGQGDLLDLGCGTGDLAVPLAKYFNKVIGLDLDPAMIKQARLRSKKVGLHNIGWRIGSSKDLPVLKRPLN